jgi:hypothetical protein
MRGNEVGSALAQRGARSCVTVRSGASPKFWAVLVCEQRSPHQIQRLAHGEVKTQINRALWSARPEPPCPAGPCAISAPAQFVDSVLAQHHDHTNKQPDCVLFECCWRNWLFFPSW